MNWAPCLRDKNYFIDVQLKIIRQMSVLILNKNVSCSEVETYIQKCIIFINVMQYLADEERLRY